MHDIAIDRLYSQQLAHTTLTQPGDLVAYMGALQAQDYAGAKWSVGIRLPGSTDEGIEQALADKTIIRTWAMRGTLHFVAPPDIRWMLALIAPYIIAGNTRRYRELKLDSRTLIRSNEVLLQALQGGKQLDRPALRAVLGENGIQAEGQRLPYILQRASLEGLICQIGMRRNNPVYASLDEWLPGDGTVERDAARAKLAMRYFTSRGPATLQDFVWWSGLPVAEARAGLEAVKSSLTRETIHSQTYWNRSFQAEQETPSKVFLLPGFDEYLLSYKDRSASLEAVHGKIPAPPNSALSPTIMTGGRIVGTWKRTVKEGAVVIVSNFFTPLTAAEDHAFVAATRRYGEFLGMPIVRE